MDNLKELLQIYDKCFVNVWYDVRPIIKSCVRLISTIAHPLLLKLQYHKMIHSKINQKSEDQKKEDQKHKKHSSICQFLQFF